MLRRSVFPRRSRSSESDGLGSVIGEVGGEDINHNVVKSICKLDVYGAVRQSSGASESNHKFVGALGHTSESSTDLIYMRARYYDPVVGRFISEDPAKDGMNWFVYCGGDPVNATDPDGRFDVSVLELGLTVLAAGIRDLGIAARDLVSMFTNEIKALATDSSTVAGFLLKTEFQADALLCGTAAINRATRGIQELGYGSSLIYLAFLT